MKYELSVKDGVFPRPMKFTKASSDSQPRLITPSYEIPTGSLNRTPGSLSSRIPSTAACGYVSNLLASRSDKYSYNQAPEIPFHNDLS